MSSKDVIKEFIATNFQNWEKQDFPQDIDFSTSDNELYKLDTGEIVLFSYTNVNITGTERAKPQIRVFLEGAQAPFAFAKENNYRFFLFTIFTQDDSMATGLTAFAPRNFIVSLETNLDNETSRRDLRSLYDYVQDNLNNKNFIRCPRGSHNAGINQASFINIGDKSNRITNVFENYVTFFDNRPYLESKDINSATPISDENTTESSEENTSRIVLSATPFTSPEQIIFYGVPGSGKSHEIKHKLEEEYKIPEEKQDLFVERTVFHPEYTNADFIGQIMPKLVQGKTDFVFKPGPFTSILKKALCDSQNRYVLIIEEINRGNAAAIFGELFQLLDRIDAASKTTSHDGSLNTYGKGWSEYFVMNSEINNYIRNSDDTFDSKALDINGIHFSANTGIRLPPNLSILATMNTSDQNVFTLDNAFQRRWDMKLIENVFRDTEEETNQRNAFVDSAKQITWEKFQTAINIKIGKMSEDAGLSSMEDKRLGCWFVKAEKTTEKDKDGKDIYIIQNELFAEKVLKYLWDDAFKFCREKVFNGYTNLESLTCDFKGEKEFAVFKNLFSETEN